MAKRGRPKKVVEPVDLKVLIMQALVAGDTELAQRYMNELKGEPLEEIAPSRQGNRVRGKIFKKNKFEEMDSEKLVKKSVNYSKKGEYLGTSIEDREERRDSNLIETECNDCHRKEQVSPLLISPRLGDGREATRALYICNNCVGGKGPR